LRKILFAIFLLFTVTLNAQVSDTSNIPSTDSLSLPADSLSQEVKDSLLKEVRYILDALNEPRSFFTFETSIGNRNFSLHNNIFNAKQMSTNKFTLVPNASYIHKSGFGASVAAYMTWEQQPRFFQYAFSPSYDHFGKKFGYGLSYTYYITRNDLEFYTTPIKHEFYGYINSKKGWLRPRLAAGWATGSYREVSRLDTTIYGIRRTIIDTSTVDINGFTLMASLMHEFSRDKIFNSKDNISLIPQLSVVAGTENYSTYSQGKLITRTTDRRFVRRYKINEEDKSGFRINSFAFSLYLTYYNGPLYISPQYFVSYFPRDPEKKFSNIISLSVGVLF
jgi:hypothetical protein